MKLAVVGKGGAGKTSISGTMARVIARRGRRVLAIDGDPNPNLGLAIGIPPRRMQAMPTLSADLVERTGGGYRLTRTFEEVCEAHSVEGPDGVTLLAMKEPQRAGTG